MTVRETIDKPDDATALAEIPVLGFDFIEFYVGNALQAAYYYHQGFGYDIVDNNMLPATHCPRRTR